MVSWLIFVSIFHSPERWFSSDAHGCCGCRWWASCNGVPPPQRPSWTHHLLEEKQHPGQWSRWEDHCKLVDGHYNGKTFVWNIFRNSFDWIQSFFTRQIIITCFVISSKLLFCIWMNYCIILTHPLKMMRRARFSLRALSLTYVF